VRLNSRVNSPAKSRQYSREGESVTFLSQKPKKRSPVSASSTNRLKISSCNSRLFCLIFSFVSIHSVCNAPLGITTTLSSRFDMGGDLTRASRNWLLNICGCRSPRRRRYNPYEPEASLCHFYDLSCSIT